MDVSRLRGVGPLYPVDDEAGESAPAAPTAPAAREPDSPLEHLEDAERLRGYTFALPPEALPRPPLPAVPPLRKKRREKRKGHRPEPVERTD